jgi:ferredoxin
VEFEISFEGSDKEPVKLKAGEKLSEHLTVQNSPILFGCRTGICGTCAIEIIDGPELHSRTHEEKEFLEVMAPDMPKFRLACQIKLNAHIKIKKVEI